MRLTEAHDALSAIARKLDRLNAAETRHGLPTLEDNGLTWEQRTSELERLVARVAHQVVEDRRPDEQYLTSLGAHVLAFLIALHRAEMLDVGSGNRFTCLVCRRDDMVARYGDTCEDCEDSIAKWDGEGA